MRNWTKSQLAAIQARQGTLLVSAAAGSGKTSVLVQRILERISSEENPYDIDHLLVVTFTRLAAAEMKERLARAINEKLSENPNNSHLHRQQFLLPRARICTIDSFCNDIVRDNFHQLNLSPDYRVADENELALFQEEALSSVIEDAYRAQDETFLSLVEQFGDRRGDAKLEDVVRKLSEYAVAYPFPEQVLDGFAALYRSGEQVKESIWGKELSHSIQERLRYMSELNSRAIRLCEEDALLTEKYLPSLQTDQHHFLDLISALEKESWDSVSQKVEHTSLTRLGMVRGYADNPLKTRVSGIRKLLTAQLGLLKKELVASEEEHREDLELLSPLINRLVALVKAYNETYFAIKSEHNSYSFDDIEHFAVKLLCDTDEAGNTAPSLLARELSEQFEEILIDEYQDTNECQDMLFHCLSRREENMFLVGDVKQSIYRFRKAMPQIFLRRRAAYPEYQPNQYPGKIMLGENFRSRKGVTGFVNFVFRQLMTPKIGELYYDEGEALKASAQFPEKECADAEIHYVEYDNSDKERTRFSDEAEYAAQLIQKMIAGGKTVRDAETGAERPATYSDFCVILRKLAGGCAKAYTTAFRKHNIPYDADFSESFFESEEIQTILSLLSVVDNVLLDIPLLAVMMSPIYAFTPDEMTDIRLKSPGLPLYTAVQNCAEAGNKKSRLFLKQLHAIRRLAAVLPANVLLKRIYDLTGYPSMVDAMPNGGQRRANLMQLMEYAITFEDSGYKGLTGFVRFLNRLREKGRELSGGGGRKDSDNAVTIMTIHKSKGLEFPICILGCLSSEFNKKALDAEVLLHPTLGIGLKRRDTDTNNTFRTIPYQAVRTKTEGEDLSEELRCLYVAMTRAKEKLVCLVETPDTEKLAAGIQNKMTGGEVLSPYFVRSCKSYGEWLTAALLRHPDAASLRENSEMGEVLSAESSISLSVSHYIPDESEDKPALPARPDPDLLQQISSRLSYTYPFAGLSVMVAKRSASEFAHSKLNQEYFAQKRPAFLQSEGLSAAQKGTAMHKFAQYADLAAARTDVEREVERMVRMRLLSPSEGASLQRTRLMSFLNSGLVERMLSSHHVMREQRFSILLSLAELYPELEEAYGQEKMLVQGVADVVFEEKDGLVIVDYKNDRVRDGGLLADKYRDQLKIYSKAFTMISEQEVTQCLLYSFALGQEITVNFA